MRYLIAVLCALAVLSVQGLYGGAMRPVFALPGLALTGLAGALGLVAVFWRNIPAPSVSAVFSVLAFAGWLIWREMESPDAWLAAGYLRLTVGCLVMYLLFACVVTNPFHRLAFVCLLLAAAVFQAGAAAWQFARPETGPLLPWLSEQLRIWYAPKWNHRGHGTYLNGNHLIWFLNFAGLMALALTCWGRWGLKTKIVCLYAALAVLAGALVTLSRGGFLGLGVGLVVFLLLSAQALAVGARNRRIVAVLVVAAAVLAAITTGFSIFKSSFVVQQRVEILVNDSYRPVVFEAVLRQAQLEPLLGTGAGTFLFYGRIYREMISFSDDVYAHNDWAQIAADFGFPALFLLVVVVALHGAAGLSGLQEVLKKRMATHSRPQSHAAALLIGALAALAAFVVHSFFDFNMQIPANALLAAACLGMLANGGVTSGAALVFSSVFRRVACLAAGAAGLWLVVLVVNAAPAEYAWLQAENAQMTGRLEDARKLAVEGMKAGGHDRLERTLGEIYLTAAMGAEQSAERQHWARLAAKAFEGALPGAPLDGRPHLLLAEARVRLEQASETRVIEAIRRDPGQGRAYELYAEMLEKKGLLAEAQQMYLVASRLPGNLHSRKSAADLAKKIQILNR